MKIIDGVYAYVWNNMFENNSNMYYFGEPLNILFDPGLKNFVDSRIKEMEKDGLDPNLIKYIVNTHGHPDHYEGCAYFKDKKIPVAIYKDELEFLNKIGPLFYDMMGMSAPEVKFDTILEEGKWKIGETELEIFHTPGHSPGSVCIYWPDKKTLVCGDLIFESSVGRIDFPGGDGEKLLSSLKKMSGLDIEILLPGHMNLIKGKKEVEQNFHFINHYFSFQ